jgi:mRNA-degrading endonuclease RelE of RelBE toxin-antitoxin system
MYYQTEISFNDLGRNDEMKSDRFRVMTGGAALNDRSSNDVKSWFKALNKGDQKTAYLALFHFLKLTQEGVPLKELAGDKIHEAFAPFFCDASQKHHTVWRYRKGVIRLLFFYVGNHLILLAGVVAKRSDQLTAGEKKQAVGCVTQYLKSNKLGQIVELVDGA